MKAKGKETKDNILKVSRNLFYEYGYDETTSRMICDTANVNLGLLNYYFNGKIDIAANIYFEVRNTFDELLKQLIPDASALDIYFISSAIELLVCIKCDPFGRFYNQIINAPIIQKRMISFNTSTIKKFSSRREEEVYPQLAALSIGSIKPALVAKALSEDSQIDCYTYLTYYLEQQLHYFGLDCSKVSYYINILQDYYITVAKNFTPIMSKLK